MFYKTNAHLLEMLKNLKFIPSDKNTLEVIINSTKTAGTFNRYFGMYRKWFNKVYSTDIEKGKKELLSLCNSSYLYYEYLYKYILNTQSFKEVYAALAQLYHQQNPLEHTTLKETYASQDKILDGRDDSTESRYLAQLNHRQDYASQINPQQSTDVSKLFDLLERVFGYRSDCVKPLKLKSEITLEEIATIYKKYTSLLSELFSAICSLEDRIIKDNWTDWKCDVLGDKALAQLYHQKNSSDYMTIKETYALQDKILDGRDDSSESRYLAQLSLNNKLEIQDPSIVIVSFCNDTSKYFMHTQKMISAMLFKTDTNYSFDDRAFGFMYNAKQEDFIAMSFSDMYSSTVTIESLEESFQTLFCGKPMLTVDKIIEATPIDLLPLYDLNELLNSTYDYNELLLKPDAKPYGIFVWEKRLSKCFSQVCSLSTVMHIPLFICRQDGSLLIINWQNVFEDVKKYLEKMATKQL